MFNIDLGQVPAESLAIPAIIIAAIFIYFAPHMISHGYRKGQQDTFTKAVGERLSIAESDIERHEKKIANHNYRLHAVEQRIKLGSYGAEESPDGTSKGRGR